MNELIGEVNKEGRDKALLKRSEIFVKPSGLWSLRGRATDYALQLSPLISKDVGRWSQSNSYRIVHDRIVEIGLWNAINKASIPLAHSSVAVAP